MMKRREQDLRLKWMVVDNIQNALNEMPPAPCSHLDFTIVKSFTFPCGFNVLKGNFFILHEGGRIIANGTLVELKALFPPTKVEYVEKQPSLEEIFFAIVGKKEEK